MRNTFTTPEYLSGIDRGDTSEQQGVDTEELRSWGTFAEDVAIDALAKPVLSAVRTGCRPPVRRTARISTAADIDRWTGRQQKALDEERSPRAQALDTLSLAPGPDRAQLLARANCGQPSQHAAVCAVHHCRCLDGWHQWCCRRRSTWSRNGGSRCVWWRRAINELRDSPIRPPSSSWKNCRCGKD